MSKLFLLALLVAVFAGACSSGDGEGSENTNTIETTHVETAGEETTPPAQPGLAEDPDDVDFLDVASLSAVRQGDLLAVSLTTYEEWDETNLERLSVLYDTDLDGQVNYFGQFSLTENAPSLMIFGENQRLDPVPVERPDDRTVQFVHPIEVLFISSGGGPEFDIQVAVESTFEGETDRAPDRGWLLVAFAP